MPSEWEVIGESMVRKRAKAEVGRFRCVEGRVVGAEISIELGRMQYRTILVTASLIGCRA